MTEARRSTVLGATIALFLGVLFLCPLLGPTQLSFDRVFFPTEGGGSDQDARIFFSVRLPRHLLAGLAGSAMACAGMVFQAVLRNPLACPFTLGVAGGSSFGAVVAILLGLSSATWGFSWLTFFSFLGALLSLLMVYSLSLAFRSFSAITLLLGGIAISYFFNALVLLAYYLADFTQAYSMIHWMIGSLDVVEMGSVRALGLGSFVGFLLLWVQARDLNVLCAGEELAKTKGVATGRVATLCIGTASLMTSAVVALTGPIAFVGLIVPHIFRLLMGNDHRFLIPAGALGGGAFLMACDTVARTCFGPSELPVGVLTALLGVPTLLWLLLRPQVRPA